MNKKFLMSIFICLLLGFMCAFIVYKSYNKDKTVAVNSDSEVLYFIQVGVFKSYDNVNNMTKTLKNYLVIEENNLFFVYVGITKNKKNLLKLEEFFKRKGNNIYIKHKKINNKNFINKINKYDALLSETNDYDTIEIINKEVLSLYKKEVK